MKTYITIIIAFIVILAYLNAISNKAIKSDNQLKQQHAIKNN